MTPISGQKFTLYGGTITGIKGADQPNRGYTLEGSYSGDSSTSITIEFTSTSSVPNLVLAWGGNRTARGDGTRDADTRDADTDRDANQYPGSHQHGSAGAGDAVAHLDRHSDPHTNQYPGSHRDQYPDSTGADQYADAAQEEDANANRHQVSYGGASSHVDADHRAASDFNAGADRSHLDYQARWRRNVPSRRRCASPQPLSRCSSRPASKDGWRRSHQPEQSARPAGAAVRRGHRREPAPAAIVQTLIRPAKRTPVAGDAASGRPFMSWSGACSCASSFSIISITGRPPSSPNCKPRFSSRPVLTSSLEGEQARSRTGEEQVGHGRIKVAALLISLLFLAGGLAAATWPRSHPAATSPLAGVNQVAVGSAPAPPTATSRPLPTAAPRPTATPRLTAVRGRVTIAAPATPKYVVVFVLDGAQPADFEKITLS